MVDVKELKKLLMMMDISIPKLAELAGVDVSTVYRWLQSPEKMTVGTVDLIRQATKMSKDDFVRIFYANSVA